MLYFDGSLAGLDIGAPVQYRGVQIGEVCDLRLEYNTTTGEIIAPVYIELEPERITYIGSGGRHYTDGPESHIERGLRAQLQSQSLITGKLKIMFVEEPDTPAKFVGGDPTVQEIPTIPTLVEALSQSIENLPLADIVMNVNETLEQISGILGSEETEGAIASLGSTMARLESLVAKLEESLPPLVTSFRENSDTFLETQKQLEATLTEVHEMLDSKSPARYQLGQALEKISEAAAALEHLADYIQQHPEAILTGKQP